MPVPRTMSVSHRFACSPDSVAGARRFAGNAIRDLPGREQHVVSLIVSELATNCVVHAHSEFVLEIERTPRELGVSVIDLSEGFPEIQWPHPSVAHGRGLQIVNELSGDWGTAFDGPVGKKVWFTLPLEPAGT
jgi:anti-sigma regulatory factor (Ser/Thr protein kinase)